VTIARATFEPARAAASREEAYLAAIRAFGDVAGALGDVREIDDLLHLIAKHICDLVGVHRCSVYLRDKDSDLFRGQVGHADRDIDAQVKRLVAGVPGDEFTGEILRTKAPVTIRDAPTDPRPIQSAMRAWKIRSMMGVPMIVRGEVIGLVFLDDEETPHAFDPIDEDIAAIFADLAAAAINQAQLTGKLRSSLDTVARQNQLLRRAATIEDRLTKLVLDGGDVREIASAVAQLTVKPCAIHDAQFQRIALAMPPGLEETVTPRILDDAVRATPAVADALAALDATRGGVVEPIPSAGLNNRFMLAPVIVRDDVWGHVVVMEYKARFGPLDMHVCRRAATNIAVEMSAERRAATAEWNARASLAGELIRGAVDTGSLQHRADYLGIRLDVPRVLCLVTPAEGQAAEIPDPRAVASHFVAAGAHGVLATGVAEGVVVMLELPAQEPVPTAVRGMKGIVATACDRIDPSGSLLAGISTVCRSVADYERAYVQAGQVVSCVSRFTGGAERVLAADDLGAGRLLLSAADHPEVERFAQETLAGLLAQGETAKDLVTTLAAFFDHGRSIRRTAAALDVHENTIRYRLARVEEAIGLPVATDADAQLTAQLALLVLRLQGRLPAAEAAPLEKPTSD
jgi:GAF domain-containing protein/sugar diacid utilization regulator